MLKLRKIITLIYSCIHQQTLPNKLLSHPAISSFVKMASSHANNYFDEKKDRFECIILDLRKGKHQCEDDQFLGKLEASLSRWKAAGVRAVTVYVHSEIANRIPILIQLGFDFHHANPGYVLLLKWLSDTETNNFPSYADHYLGVAGFVVNDSNQVLAIKERFHPGSMAKWKLPGGGADCGEELGETAVREVFEETGIKTEFVGVLCMRHLHGFRYNCSDFYYVCLLKALSTDIRKCDEELEECVWMDLEEYGKQDLHPSNRFIYESYLKAKECGLLMVPYPIKKYTGDSCHLMYVAEKVDEL